jgi:phosphatidylinositol N-acetylglucosaminyltransferase subunit Q
LYRNSPYPIDIILDRCGKSPLQVLGVVNPSTTPSGPFNPASLVAFTSSKSKFPELYCPDNGNYTVQILLFDRPNPKSMQYLSLAPISLALGDKTHHVGQGNHPLDKVEIEEEKERARKRALAEKLRLHTVIKHPPAPKESVLPLIIDQINCSYELNALLQKNIGLIGTRARRALSVGERVVKSATNLWEMIYLGLWHILTVWVYPILAQIFILGLMTHRIIAEILLMILDWRLFPNHAALKDVSATAQQLDIRLQQFCYWPVQFVTLRKRNQTWKSVTNIQPEYIRFYNSLWLVANDIIIGIALGSFIIENAYMVAFQIDRVLDAWTIDGLRRMIIWLMDWPAGLKLNTELATFLGDLFLWVIDYWSGCMDMFRPYLPEIIRFIGYSSFAGATFPISLFSDLTSILTLHIYAFYVASARIYNWQVSIIGSLFQLFRGKKINVLRKRIDSCDYDLDQLLLGTILFTLLFFLLPTVVVFYLTFASARMAIISFKAGLDTLLACLNHFPLFALMLRFKDSLRLPGGIHFELQEQVPSTVSPSSIPTSPSSSSISSSLSKQPSSSSAVVVSPPPTTTKSPQATTATTATTTTTTTTPIASLAPTSSIYLRSVALPFLAMFNEYSQLGNRIRHHYVSLGVIGCLVLGRFVPPIHRKNLYSLQYSMLPAQRISIPALWRLLMAERPLSSSSSSSSSFSGPGGSSASGEGGGGVNGQLQLSPLQSSSAPMAVANGHGRTPSVDLGMGRNRKLGVVK